jgi:tRNA(Arg) A34 adenosine deaminase TadA
MEHERPLQELRIGLPEWTQAFVEAIDGPLTTTGARMRLAISLARANVERGTGGPFGAAVFERDSGALLSVGVNRVVSQHCSAAHAEILALALAQQRLHSYTLATAPRPLQLVTSAEPCAMCLGAIVWSGVSELVTGATDADAREVGFDEGTKPATWEEVLTSHGIRVVARVLRPEAREVLKLYSACGGEIYNG